MRCDLRNKTSLMGHVEETGSWNRLMEQEQTHEQTHGTDLWNRIMNRFMEQTYGTES